MRWILGLIVVWVCAVIIGFFAIPGVMRLRDRRRESRQQKTERPEMKDGEKKEDIRSLDGTPLYADYLGDSDPTIFFVHGILTSGQAFKYQRPFFAKKYRVVSLDLRGHGRSSMPDSGDFCIDRMADDVKAVIDSFNPQQFVVVGWSMGGFTTFDFYERHGHEYEGRLKGLAILDSTGADTTGIGWRWRWSALFLQFLMDDPIIEVVKNWFGKTAFMYEYTRWLAFGKKALASEVDFINRMGSKVSIKAMKRSAKASVNHRMEYCLPNVDVPVLMVVGDEDTIQAKDHLNSHTCALLPDSRLKVVESAGHHALLERPDEVNEALDEFFTECFRGGQASASADAISPGAKQSKTELVPDSL